MVLPPSFLDRFPRVITRIGPIHLAAPAEHNIAAADRILIDRVIFRRPAASKRHLENFPVAIDGGGVADCFSSIACGKIGDQFEDAVLGLEAETCTLVGILTHR